jgi:hypothetical protein
LPQNDFTKILLSAVEESLSSLGDSSKQAIFFHLEASFKIRKERIPAQLAEFTAALERIFGPGAPYLEKLIGKNLHEKLGLKFEDARGWDLLASVDNVRKHLVFEGECTAP